MATQTSPYAAKIQQVAGALSNNDPHLAIRMAEDLQGTIPSKFKAEHASIANLIANAHLRLGNFTAAREACQRGLRRMETPFLFGNLALSELQLGNNDKASRHIDKAIRMQPANAEFYRIKTLALIQSGELDEAQSLVDRVIAKANMPQVYHFLTGRICRLRGDHAAAIMHFERALNEQPNDPGLYFELRLVHVMRKDYPAALDVLNRLAQTGHNSHRLHVERALVLEVLNRLDEAEAAIHDALALNESNAEAIVALANLERRRGNDESAAERLFALVGGDLPPRLQSDIHYALGAALDKLDRTDEAMEKFDEANRLKAALYSDLSPNRKRAAEVLAQQKALADGFADADKNEPDDSAPVFLIGFPRSGTTLIGQILDIHPGIHVHEEENALSETLLAELTPAEARDNYRAVSRSLGGKPELVIVDKMPIDLVIAPRILQVFPGARFVFVLRDPRDACLSCFMQNFDVNDLTANFLTFRDTVDYYVATMDAWLGYQDKLPIDCHTLRYESLAEAPEPAVRALTDWLGVTFDAAMLDESRRGAAGRMITTPSYRDVGAPIGTTAVGRWQRYEARLADGFARLAPFVERFDY